MKLKLLSALLAFAMFCAPVAVFAADNSQDGCRVTVIADDGEEGQDEVYEDFFE